MRIYLDSCCLQRPLDDQTQPRIRIETEAVLTILALAAERLHTTDSTVATAESLAQRGVSAIDAVHLALASEAKADFFATCDDRLLSKGQAATNLGCKVISALGLVSEVIK